MTSSDPPITREDILTVFDRFDDPQTPVTAAEVATTLDCSRPTAAEMLATLVERGTLRTKDVGATERVWWRPVRDPIEALPETTQFGALVQAVTEYAIFTLDRDGHVTSWNAGAERIKGYTDADILDEHFSVFYPETDIDAGIPETNLAKAATDGDYTDEGWRVRRDGTRFWANITITALYDDDDSVYGYIKVTRDNTERHEHEQQLQRERDLRERILDASPIGISSLTPEGEILLMNERAAAIVGTSADELLEEPDLGKEECVYDPNDNPIPPENRPFNQVLQTGEPVFGVESQIERPDGDRVWLSVNGMPVVDSADKIEQIILTYEDITQLKRQAQQLERQRDDLKRELQDMFARVDDAFLALDREWRFTYVSERAEELIEKTEADLLGNVVWDEYPEAVGTTFQTEYERAMATQQVGTFEEYYPPLDTWFAVRAYPSETGLSVYFQDISERKERERELEDYRTAVETVRDGVYMTDADRRFTMVNEACAEMVGYDREELLSEHVSLVLDDETTARTTDVIRELHEGDREVATIESYHYTADGERIPVETRFTLRPTNDDTFQGTTGVIRDRTDRLERQRELERYETIVETVNDGVYTVDADQRFTMVNEAYADMVGYSCEELLGEHVSLVVDETVVATAREVEREMTDGTRAEPTVEADLRQADGGTITAEATFSLLPGEDTHERVGVVRDITARKRYEQDLETQITQQQATATLGERALEETDLDRLMDEAVELVAETLETDYCNVLELLPDGKQLLLRAGVGWRDGVVGTATVEADHRSHMGYTLRSTEPVVVEDLSTETRFSGPEFLTDHGVVSGVSIIIGSPTTPWGIFEIHDRAHREFSGHDINFVQSVANILATAIERANQGLLLTTTRSIAEAETFEDGLRTVLHEICAVTQWEYGEVWTKSDGALECLVADASGDQSFESVVSAARERRIEWGEGLAGRVWETQEPEWVRDISTASIADFPRQAEAQAVGLKATLGVPITAENEVVAVLVFSMPKARERNEWMVEFTFSIASELGNVISRRQIEEALEREKELVEQILETNPIGVTVLTADGELVRLNSHAERLFGRSREEVLGLRLTQAEWRFYDENDQLIPVEDHPPTRILDTGNAVRNWDAQFERLDGQRIWVSVNAAPITLSDGTVTHVVLTTKDITEQKRREREFKRQIEALQPLNRYNTLVRALTEATVEESTVRGLEQVVCETFASFDAYSFAVIGEFTPDEEFVPRSWGGIDESEVETILAMMPGKNLQMGLGSVAVHTNTVQVTQVAAGHTGTDAERQSSTPAVRDYRAVAFVPLSANDVVHGVLSVYATSAFAFTEADVRLLEELGQTIGLAIATMRNRQLVYAETSTELDVEITGAQDVFLTTSEEMSCSLTIDTVIPVTGESYLAYVTVDGTAPEQIVPMVTDAPDVQDVRVVDADTEHEQGTLEVHLASTASLAQIIEYGVDLTTFVADCGIGRLGVASPSRDDTQSLLRWLYQMFDEVQFESLQEIPWTPREPPPPVNELDIGLTERQREVIETAYHAGYFAWPRESTAEEVAAAMEITPPTLHHHLRKGERKIIAAFVEPNDEQSAIQL